jgi:methionyl-tRNA formyltransferase
VQRGLWNGDSETGLTVFSLVEELDAGPIVYQRPIPFVEMETASEALTRVSHETADEVNEVVGRFVAGDIVSHEQSGPVTLAPKFRREDGRIDWTSDAPTVVNRIRAVTSEPGAYAVLGKHQLAVLRVRLREDVQLEPGVVSVIDKRVCVGTATSAIELISVKPAGKSEMSGPDWARGLHATTRLT